MASAWSEPAFTQSGGLWIRPGPCRDSNGVEVIDVVFVGLTIGVFVVLALCAKGVEKL